MQAYIVVEVNPDGVWLKKGFAKEKDATEFLLSKREELNRRLTLDHEKPKNEQHFQGWSYGENAYLFFDSVNVKL